MRAAGILIIEGASQFDTRGRSDGDFVSSSFSDSFSAPISLRSFALQDLLGESILSRMINRLERCAIQPISVLSEGDGSCNLWSSLENQLIECAEQDIKAAVVIWLGGYTEINFFELLRVHRENREPVTWVHDFQGPLPISVFDLKQRRAWADLLSDGWNAHGSAGARYRFDGYVNRLENAFDFRRLTQDALLRRCELQPVGTESRPGVWLGEGARVDSRARILAPAYVGAHTRIGAAALITRASSVERNSQVDCGTIVDDSNVLPYSYLGPGLELAHALVAGSQLLNLPRNLELEFRDHRLLGPLPSPTFRFGIRPFPLRNPQTSIFEHLPTPTESPKPASLYSAGEIASSS